DLPGVARDRVAGREPGALSALGLARQHGGAMTVVEPRGGLGNCVAMPAFDFVFFVQRGTTIVRVGLPVGSTSWSSTPWAIGSALLLLEVFVVVSFSWRSTNSAEGRHGLPGVPAVQRGTTTVRAPGACGSVTAVVPCTFGIALTFDCVTVAGGLHGGTTIVRLASAVGTTTARAPASVVLLLLFGISTPPSTPMKMNAPITYHGV